VHTRDHRPHLRGACKEAVYPEGACIDYGAVTTEAATRLDLYLLRVRQVPLLLGSCHYSNRLPLVQEASVSRTQVPVIVVLDVATALTIGGAEPPFDKQHVPLEQTPLQRSLSAVKPPFDTQRRALPLGRRRYSTARPLHFFPFAAYTGHRQQPHRCGPMPARAPPEGRCPSASAPLRREILPLASPQPARQEGTLSGFWGH